jgi:hypothetical protein
MLPKTHIIYGLFASLILFLVFPQITLFYTLIIFLSSVLIDFDHYLYYAIRFKDWSLKNAYNWFLKNRDAMLKIKPEARRNYRSAIMVFHGIEFWIVLGLLIFVHKIFLFVLIGIAIHMILDFIEILSSKKPIHIKTSQVYTHIRNKSLKEII